MKTRQKARRAKKKKPKPTKKAATQGVALALKTRQKARRAKKKKPKPTKKAATQGVALALRDSQGLQPQASTSIVRAESAVPSVLKTVHSLEQVRRFVSRCLNVDLQRREAKLGKKLPEEERKALEVDWGTIPGVNKPFLLQPGAEKFCFWLNIRPKYLNREQEMGEGHLEIVSQVRFFSKQSGEEVFEGPECSCSTLEDNYRYRFQEIRPGEKVPSREEGEELKALGLGRWRKKQEWKDGHKVGDKWVWLARVDNPNIHNERNKVRQIGEKRALVKGVRNMGAMSEIFVTNPEEWNIPDDIDEGPQVDASYTEGGRKIVPNEPECPHCGKAFSKVPNGCAEQTCPWRKGEISELKLTPEQKAVLDAKMNKTTLQQPGTAVDRPRESDSVRDPQPKPAQVPQERKPVESGAGANAASTPSRQSSAGAAPEQAEGKTGAAALSSPAPVLYYHWSDQGQKATIVSPPFELTSDIKAIIRKAGVVLNGEELEALKFELEKRGIKLLRRR